MKKKQKSFLEELKDLPKKEIKNLMKGMSYQALCQLLMEAKILAESDPVIKEEITW